MEIKISIGEACFVIRKLYINIYVINKWNKLLPLLAVYRYARLGKSKCKSFVYVARLEYDLA